MSGRIKKRKAKRVKDDIIVKSFRHSSKTSGSGRGRAAFGFDILKIPRHPPPDADQHHHETIHDVADHDGPSTSRVESDISQPIAIGTIRTEVSDSDVNQVQEETIRLVMESTSVVILGLAGTRALIQVVKKALSTYDRNLSYRFIICRHSFSIGTPEKELSISHNQSIEDEEGCETEYYQLLESMRRQGIDVLSFTQGSSYGDIPISRYSGVKVKSDEPHFEGNPYMKNPPLDMVDINKELAQCFSKSIGDQDFMLDCFRSTHIRHGYYGCFLHDVKVYFTACSIHKLLERGIVRKDTLYIRNGLVFNYPVNHGYRIEENVIQPNKIGEFSKLFNQWLSSNQNRINVDYVVTDPGPGHKKNNEEFTISQDVDDIITLCMIPHINHVCISDETSLLTRTIFLISKFNHKFNTFDIFHNKSVKYTIDNSLLYRSILSRNPILCDSLLLFLKKKNKLNDGLLYHMETICSAKNSTASKVDSDSISSMSFVPKAEQREQLYQVSLEADHAIRNKTRGPLLSKLHHLPGEYGLCPLSLNPDDTVLAKNGREATPIVEDGGVHINIIPDRNMPFCGGSNGPNSVLTDCNGPYGENRINLFYKNKKETMKLLSDYITFRDSNIKAVFKLFVDHMCEFKIDLTKNGVLAEDLQDNYKDVCSMFTKILESEKALGECGISWVSFCQTWLRNGGVVGDAHFSVMSPHMQTRFFVSNDDGLNDVGVTAKEIQSYIILIRHHDKNMTNDYGNDGGGEAFIHLDNLYSELLD